MKHYYLPFRVFDETVSLMGAVNLLLTVFAVVFSALILRRLYLERLNFFRCVCHAFVVHPRYTPTWWSQGTPVRHPPVCCSVFAVNLSRYAVQHFLPLNHMEIFQIFL